MLYDNQAFKRWIGGGPIPVNLLGLWKLYQ
jgi:hypothetical protein